MRDGSPTASDSDVRRTLDQVVRRERGRLVADLVGRLGAHQVDLAEDVAQEAVLTALSVWPYRGIPDNPGAWLATVARRRAIDRLRQRAREAPLAAEDDPAPPVSLLAAHLPDPSLQLMFLCCNDALGERDQLALTLRLVSGFTAREIGQVLLQGDTAVGQRLSRAKRRLRDAATAPDEAPAADGIRGRLPTALKIVYLMFSLGYAPRQGDQLIRSDVALAALRLARELASTQISATPAACALASLLCLQASRLGTREDADGNLVLLADQQRDKWDRGLIDEGMGWLARAKQGDALSRYHLEAGIAAAHATAPDEAQCDWSLIRRYFDVLTRIAPSPIVSLNACIAQAISGDPSAALERLTPLADELADYGPFHVARAEILGRLARPVDAADAYRRALTCSASTPVHRHLNARLATLL